MAQTRVEVYDDKGLTNVYYIETDEPEEPTIEEQIAEKEAKLIEIYDEIQALRSQLNK